MRQARHVTRVGERRVSYRILVGQTGKRHDLINLGIDESTILKWISIK
jgi:hypothetical protein